MFVEVTKIIPLFVLCIFFGAMLGAGVMALCNISSTYSKLYEEEVLTMENGKLNIKIKYFEHEIDKVKAISKGNWIDLRSAETVHLKKGEFHLIPLGVGMKLPEGYEANIVPRSSTYKNFKVLQTNSFAVIDNSYSGDNDQWFYPVIAMEDTVIHKNDRICQFRINKIQPSIEFDEVDHLDNTDRGGFGSSGRQ